MEAEKYIEERLQEMEEGIFGGGKSAEEVLAKSLVKILKDKAKDQNVKPKDVLGIMMQKIK